MCGSLPQLMFVESEGKALGTQTSQWIKLLFNFENMKSILRLEDLQMPKDLCCEQFQLKHLSQGTGDFIRCQKRQMDEISLVRPLQCQKSLMNLRLGRCSVVEHVLSIQEVLGSIPSTTNKQLISSEQKKREKKTIWVINLVSNLENFVMMKVGRTG